jgi:hypothetical protein
LEAHHTRLCNEVFAVICYRYKCVFSQGCQEKTDNSSQLVRALVKQTFTFTTHAYPPVLFACNSYGNAKRISMKFDSEEFLKFVDTLQFLRKFERNNEHYVKTYMRLWGHIEQVFLSSSFIGRRNFSNRGSTDDTNILCQIYCFTLNLMGL